MGFLFFSIFQRRERGVGSIRGGLMTNDARVRLGPSRRWKMEIK